MADIETSHHVSEVPAGADLPRSYQREVRAEVTNLPDSQAAYSNYAASTNWMSALGSEIATRSSNAIATRLGSELGKNPRGEIGPSFTEFDKNLEQSYATQAQATLGLQAQKLITQSNLELSAVPRLDSGLILNKQKQVYSGLQKIYSLAPDSVRASMEHQYGSVMIQQNEHLTNRMLGEQKQDRRNNLELANKVNSQNAYSIALAGIGLDKDGDSIPAIVAVEATNKQWKNMVAMKEATPLEAKIAGDTARQSYLTGKYTRLGLIAEKEGKLPEFLRSMADKPPGDITSQDHETVINGVVQYMNQQAALRSQDEQLKMAQFAVKLAENPGAIGGVEFAQLQSQLSPLQAQKVKLDLIQALKARKADDQKSNALIMDWGNSEIHAIAGEAAQNKGYETLVQKVVSTPNSKGQAQPTREQAEVQVAMSAGAPIPVFTKSLQFKLSSGNPQQMESAAQQIHQLYAMGAGHALAGLNEKDKALFGAYETMRNSLQPMDAARETINKIQNQDPVIFKANQEKWANYLSTASKSVPVSDFALKQFGYGKDDFLNPTIAQVYGTDMLEKYSTYYQLLGGDQDTAKRVTQRYIDENYGDTKINGGTHSTLHPLEKILGYKDHDVVPFIQQDAMDQLSKNFVKIKEDYDKGSSNEYWEIVPLSEKTHGVFTTDYDPIKVKRHTRTGNKVATQSFDVVLQGNSFDQWDFGVSSESGMRNLFQIAPYLGVSTYTPNKQRIQDNYVKSLHQESAKPIFNFASTEALYHRVGR